MARSLAIIPLVALVAACDGATTDKTDTTDTTDTTTSGDSGTTGDCPGGSVIVTGTILDDTTWTSDCVYILRAGVFVGLTEEVADDDRTTLTIDAGTRIVGEAASNGMLVINRGGRIMANGTETDPIVMTSSQKAGSRARGDWGGLILNGNATINCDRTGFEAGDFCESIGEGGTGNYGGNTDDDNSGTITYARIEFAGTLLSPDNELNGIAFQGVGSGTTTDFVQVHQNADDGIEFFGGTATIKHAVVTQVGDDSFDWTDGWTGKGQFVVLQSSADAAGDQGIEADNNGDNNNFLPRSNPTLSNFTIIGSPDNTSSDIGILLREGTSASISNTQVVGFEEACFDIDNDSTFTNGITNAGISIENTVLDCETLFKDDVGEPLTAGQIEKWFLGQTGNVAKSGVSDIDAAANAVNLASPVFSTSRTGGSVPADGFFDDSDVIGAVGADDWTTGWTAYSPN